MVARRARLDEVAPLRDKLSSAAKCQIVRWSHLPRGFAYAVAVEVGQRIVGYGSISTVEAEDCLVEFFTTEESDTLAIARAILEFSNAPLIEAQSNLPFMSDILDGLTTDPTPGPLLFSDGNSLQLHDLLATFRPVDESDAIFEHKVEPVGDWCIEWENQVVATGGCFTHYNPPYADIYMEVHGSFRKRGFGSFLIQKLREVCKSQSLIPAARCNFDNVASAKCLQRGGMVLCGNLTTARVRLSPVGQSR